MKKLTIWALLATFVVAGAAFAAPARLIAPATSVGDDPGDFADGSQPSTTDNDDSCDIGVYPAATLLLPYFEVSEDPTGETTNFTITNVSETIAIAHVVMWTDWSYPVIDFNIYLTGYDVQSINLRDLIWDGIIAPETTAKPEGTGTDISPGDFTDDEGQTLGACDELPGDLPSFYEERMQVAFTEGEVGSVPGNDDFEDCSDVGGVHANAIGYITIDVVDACTTSLPTDGADYFETEMRFDNVLIGDYAQYVAGDSGVEKSEGNTMVHIRAVPELDGGTGASATNFARTFYSRYQAGGTSDRRQPLPSLFAARWIEGGDAAFETDLKIWREGTYSDLDCTGGDYEDNGSILFVESVIFDEDENGEGITIEGELVSPPIGAESISLPETSRVSIANEDVFPQGVPDVAGWVYLNLDNREEYPIIASQNWVIVSMRAEGRYSVDFDAAALGNGCTPGAVISSFSDVEDGDVDDGEGTVGPAQDSNTFPRCPGPNCP
jgi:hypothetical protein